MLRVSGWSRRTSACRLSMIAFALILFVPVAYATSPQGTETPMEAVRKTLTEVLRILDDPALKDPAKHVMRRRMLEDIAADRFSYAEMSKRVLGGYWKQLSEGQQKEFIDVYKSFLSDRYAGKIEDYTGRKQDVGYLAARVEGSYAEVRTELRSDKTTLPMDYRLLLNENRWLAYDIIIDGVSLVSNYRSQFQKILRENSFDDLMNKLRERSIPPDTKSKPRPAGS